MVPVLLDSPVRPYVWGSTTAIAEIQDRPPSGRPEAELWVGAHPDSPSTVVGDGRTLDRFIADDAEAALGADVLARFGPRLPFLLKILAVERPLSIQVHPTTAQAVAGHAAQDAAGIPADSPRRSYHDRSHKPELVVALTDFETLLGFADPADRAALLETCEHPELAGAAALLRGADGLRNLTDRWLNLPEASARAVVEALTAEASARDEPPFALVRRLSRIYPNDRGLLLALIMRPVRLKPGQAAFVPAGLLHAHLSGVVVEPQANSDNVLRAGLTAKHVDVAEVMRLSRFEPGGGVFVHPEERADGEQAYPAPGIDEFLLSRVDLSATGVTAHGPRLVLVIDGEAVVSAASSQVTLRSGESAFIPASDVAPRLSGKGVAFMLSTALDAAR